MSSPSEPPSSPPALGGRLRPGVIGVWAVDHSGPLILMLFAGTFEVLIALSALVFAMLYSVARWSRLRWRLEPDALIVESGVLRRQRRVIPRERIQSVERVRKLRHRLFGVTELRVETVGGGQTEGLLEGLAPDVAERLLRTLLLGDQQRTDDARATEEVLARLGVKPLVLAGLTGGRVGVIAILLGGAQELFGNRLIRMAERVPGLLNRHWLVAAVLLALAVAIVAFLLSVAATVVTYWNFTLTRDGDTLYLRRGLLDQRTGTIPLRRVQAVRIEENLARRLLGLASLRVVVAGQARRDEELHTGVLLPLADRRDATALVGRVLGRGDLTHVDLKPMPRGARQRRLVRAGAVMAVSAAGVGLLTTWQAGIATALGLLVPATLIALDAYRALGYGRLNDLIVARAGVVVRRTSYVGEQAIQSLALVASPFQRRRRLASLALQIARSPGGPGDPTLLDLDRDRAWALVAELRGAERPLAERKGMEVR